MRIALFGGTGGIGRQVLGQAVDAGHELVCLARDPAKLEALAAQSGLQVVAGDIADRAAVSETVAGTDAAISAVGPSSNTAEQVDLFRNWALNLAAALAENGVRRVVLLSGAAVHVPGEQKRFGDRVASTVVRLFVRHVVAAKQAEFDVFFETGETLDWVAARPPRVIEGPRTGRYQVGLDLRMGPGSRLTQADLAAFLVSQLTDDRWIRKAPFVTS